MPHNGSPFCAAIFVHLCETFVGLQSSVRLFRRFFVLKVVSQCPPLIDGYYFQRRTQGHACYIMLVSPGRWKRWREDWVLVQSDAHDRHALLVGASTLDRTEWVKDPSLESGFDLVLDQIQHLAKNGLTSLMVLHDFLSRYLAPLQDRPTHLAWMYIGVNDIMWLERGPGSSLNEALLAACLKALTVDQFSADLVVPIAVCEPIYAYQVMRTALLTTMPTLDDIDIALVQRGDQSRGAAGLRGGRRVYLPRHYATRTVSARRAGRQVAGLLQHSTDLHHAHSGLLQYGVVQQLWVGSSTGQLATV
jgi:hypothetical protein